MRNQMKKGITGVPNSRFEKSIEQTINEITRMIHASARMTHASARVSHPQRIERDATARSRAAPRHNSDRRRLEHSTRPCTESKTTSLSY